MSGDVDEGLRTALLTLLALHDDADRDHPAYHRDVDAAWDSARAALATVRGTDTEAAAT